MQPTITKHTLQKLVSGDALRITSFVFQGTQPGPLIYLQGNLHGPEIFGTVLLVKLINYLRAISCIKGTLTLVPQANPIGVQAQTYGMIHGRWNAQTGNDWNRIFSKTEGNGIEAVLARTLISLAKDHDAVLDIHTSGTHAIPHTYVSRAACDTFNALGCAYHIVYNKEDYYGAFDETLWKIHDAEGKKISTATWEASSHITVYEKDIEERLVDIINFLSSLGMLENSKKIHSHPTCVSMKQTQWLFSPCAGYITWKKSAGEFIQKSEQYASIYEPWSGKIEHIYAPYAMMFLSMGTLQAVSEGHVIGKVIMHES
jgi:predicted deacylase